MGTDPLPDWLRRKRELIALDTYDDNLCLFRCLAVHRGSRPDRCTGQARQLAIEFWASKLAFVSMNQQKMATGSSDDSLPTTMKLEPLR